MKTIFRTTLIAAVFLSTQAASAATILIDFGKDDSGYETSGNWNNFAEDGTGGDAFRFSSTPYTMLTDMIDSDGANTGVDLVYFSEWVSSGSTGNISSGIGGADNNVATSTAYPTTATRDTMFLSAGTSTTRAAAITFELRDLEANGFYDLSFFASVPDTRQNTTWTVGSDSVSLNPGYYTGNAVSLSSVQADASGTLQIVWSNNPNTASTNNAAHWNTLEIVAVPEPSSLALLLGAMGILIACRWRARR
ncbi:PEP-CTERM sorting domain-containing protein [Kiritimatiellaeota bacterium B1221]|nr:PEP-CTERM sorting domain-containing protein [Kiritimatiellaeota bacterium B1221]